MAAAGATTTTAAATTSVTSAATASADAAGTTARGTEMARVHGDDGLAVDESTGDRVDRGIRRLRRGDAFPEHGDAGAAAGSSSPVGLRSARSSTKAALAVPPMAPAPLWDSVAPAPVKAAAAAPPPAPAHSWDSALPAPKAAPAAPPPALAHLWYSVVPALVQRQL